MNRAKPISLVLHTLLSVLMLFISFGMASAQSQARLRQLKDYYGASLQKQTRSAKLTQPHTFRGNLDKLPRDITRRRYNKPQHRAPGDGAVSRQTQILTKQDPTSVTSRIPAPAQDGHAHWSSDEKFLYFDSNRVSDTDTGPNVNGTYNIFRMFKDGSGITQMTTGSDNKLEPAVTVDQSLLAYVAGGTIDTTGGLANPTTSGFNLYVLNLSTGDTVSPTKGSPVFAFTDVRRPTWASNGQQVAFAGQVGAGLPYHIYVYNRSTGAIKQMTNGTSNDYSPAWSPDGNVIAFTSNASGFAQGTAPILSTGTKSNDDIWSISTTNVQLVPTQVTKFTTAGGDAASNRNPAWSTLKTDKLGIIPHEKDAQTGNELSPVRGEQLLAFASNRADTDGDGVADAIKPTTEIYWLHAQVAPSPVPSQAGSYVVTTPESTGNLALHLETSTPDLAIDPNEATAKFDPNFTSSEDFPAWPQYISTYRIAFQSDRGNNLNIWASTIFDVNAPSLLKYSLAANEIVHVALDSSPEVGLREASAGDKIRFRVRMVDYETGVESVYLQIKNPNSSTQDTLGEEHKVFLPFTVGLDATNFVASAPFEIDCQAVNTNDLNASGTYRGKQGASPFLPVVNPYQAGVDDVNAFTGFLHTPDDPERNNGAGFWLHLYDDGPISQGGHEPEGETKNDGVYTNSWVTPQGNPSDWILDVIAYDKAVDPFNPDQVSNWKIYDNIWGFTTKPWQTQGTVLYIGDYDIGQNFYFTHFGSGTQFFNIASWPTESWMTELDPAYLPTRYVTLTAGGTLINVLTPLGINSYKDSLTDDGTNIPITGRYDIWRINCRGPIPPSILNQYAAHTEVQPPDAISGGTGKSVVVADKCVIWHSPFTGDLFTGPGTLTDLATQRLLTDFINKGGRLFVNGQDVAWALTLGGTTPNAFLTSILHANYVADFQPLQTPVKMIAGLGLHPLGNQTWYDDPPAFHIYLPLSPGAPFYDPPSNGNINFFGDVNGTHLYSCPNLVLPDIIDFVGTQAQDIAEIDGTYNGLAAAPKSAIHWFTDVAKSSRIVFSPIGFEGITPEYFAPPTPRVLGLRNRKVEIIHNILDYLRTGSITGFVRDVQGAGPVGKAFVRAVNFRTGKTMATARTLGDGSYTLSGLAPDGIYVIDVVVAGFSAQHLQGNWFHGGYKSVVDIFLTPAPSGSISGRVSTASNGDPVAAAQVEATSNTTGDKFSAFSGGDGNYVIENTPADVYTVRVINLTNLKFASSIPPSYGGTETGAGTAVTVTASTNTPGVDFALKALPGSVSGKVTKRDTEGTDTGIGIAGAVVTATQGTKILTGVTDANGNYSITGADPGTYGVVASAPGYNASSSVTVNIVTNADTPNINIALSPIPPGSISGLVQTTSDIGAGSPIKGATVTVLDAAGNVLKDTNGADLVTTTTDAITTEGYQYNYKFTNVPAGSQVFVRARKDGYSPDPTASQSVTIAAGAETKSINFSLAPLHTFVNLETLVSAPYDYTGTSIVDLFGIPAGDVTSGSFLFTTWIQPRYVLYPNPPADTFHLGKGYFLSNNNIGIALSIVTPGTPADPTKRMEVALQPGWNMIGDPFKFSLKFPDLKVRDANGVEVDVATAQSGSDPLLGAALWTYQSGIYEIAFTVDTWRGYWVRAYKPVTLILDPAARQDRSAKIAHTRAALDFGNVSGDGWKLALTARANDAHSAPGYVGVSRAASNGYDPYKLEAPPTVGKNGNVTLTFNHTDWGSKSGAYSVDVRSAATTAQTWDFTVTSSVRNAPVTVEWPAIATVSGKQSLTLTDLDTNTRVDMRSHSSYTMPAGDKPLTRHFRLEAKRAARQKLELLDVTAHVSGDLSRASGIPPTVSIAYTTTADATVQVTVLQRGKRLRSLETGRTRAAGPQETTWDLKSDQGAIVPSDTYMVEVQAMDKDGNRVHRLVPLLITR